MSEDRVFLLSVDLEDVRTRMPDGDRYAERVPLMTRRILDFLENLDIRITFFTVGDIAERYPNLIREIIDAGHEIASHTYEHIPITEQSKEEFRADLLKSVDALERAGARNIVGFRAPIFSLTERTAWAHEVLAQCGFQYSSSVLPAPNPLFGWPEFGKEPRIVSGILEIPMTIGMSLPFAGGIYFRVLPLPLLRYLFATSKSPILSYLHPYDIDEGQEKFMHPGINESHFYNALMYYNRVNCLKKLTKIIRSGYSVMPYAEYLSMGKISDVASAQRAR